MFLVAHWFEEVLAATVSLLNVLSEAGQPRAEAYNQEYHAFEKTKNLGNRCQSTAMVQAFRLQAAEPMGHELWRWILAQCLPLYLHHSPHSSQRHTSTHIQLLINWETLSCGIYTYYCLVESSHIVESLVGLEFRFFKFSTYSSVCIA